MYLSIAESNSLWTRRRIQFLLDDSFGPLQSDEVIERAKRWFLQAEDDRDWLEDSLAGGHFAQTCLVAQQVGEKAIKSLAYARGAEAVDLAALILSRAGEEFDDA